MERSNEDSKYTSSIIIDESDIKRTQMMKIICVLSKENYDK